jgi:hypothetical protein
METEIDKVVSISKFFIVIEDFYAKSWALFIISGRRGTTWHLNIQGPIQHPQSESFLNDSKACSIDVCNMYKFQYLIPISI